MLVWLPSRRDVQQQRDAALLLLSEEQQGRDVASLQGRVHGRTEGVVAGAVSPGGAAVCVVSKPLAQRCRPPPALPASCRYTPRHNEQEIL